MLLVGDIDTAFFTFVKPWVRLFNLTFICIREHYFTQHVLTCDHDLSFYISQKVNSFYARQLRITTCENNTRFQPHRRSINIIISNNMFKKYHQVTFYYFIIIHFRNKIKHNKQNRAEQNRTFLTSTNIVHSHEFTM